MDPPFSALYQQWLRISGQKSCSRSHFSTPLSFQCKGLSLEPWKGHWGFNRCDPISPGHDSIHPPVAPPMLKSASQSGSALLPVGQDVNSHLPKVPRETITTCPYSLATQQPLPCVPKVESSRSCSAARSPGVQRHLSSAVLGDKWQSCLSALSCHHSQTWGHPERLESTKDMTKGERENTNK